LLLFHYTSRVAAQLIAIQGRVVPGKSLYAHFSPTLYDRGWLALDRLAISHTPETAMEVAMYIDHQAPPPITVVDPLRLGGIIYRAGLGLQVRFPDPVSVDSAHVIETSVP
jgi:hypothetical protein